MNYLETLNTDLPPHERLPQIFITRDDWNMANSLLTPTMKIKRKSVEEHYRPWAERSLDQYPVVFE